jgi:hypothetical protein
MALRQNTRFVPSNYSLKVSSVGLFHQLSRRMKDDARGYRTLKNRASMSLLLWSSTASDWARDLNFTKPANK